MKRMRIALAGLLVATAAVVILGIARPGVHRPAVTRIPACERYVTGVEAALRCDRLPATVRASFAASLESVRATLGRIDRLSPDDSEARDDAASACDLATVAFRERTTRLGCP